MSKEKILIVGCGPVGLSAALFLEKNGFECRIIEKNIVRQSFSKALGINARTLELFEKIDATELFLQNGNMATTINVYNESRLLVKNELIKSNVKYPFMLVLPQAYSERLFERMLNSKGIYVERGTELSEIKITNSVVDVELKHQDGRVERCAKYSKILATDGAHSFIRKKLNLSFEGNKIDKEFKIVDYEIETHLSPNVIHIFFSTYYAGFMINIRENIWRVGGVNYEKFIKSNPNLFKVIRILWESDFIIHNRVIETFSFEDCVYFAGDSAHVHSPVGGRGMNLGIEDAFVFAQLLKKGRLNQYNNLRSKAVRPVVKRIESITRFLAGDSFFIRLVKRLVPFVLPLVFPFVRFNVTKFLMGLDHDY